MQHHATGASVPWANGNAVGGDAAGTVIALFRCIVTRGEQCILAGSPTDTGRRGAGLGLLMASLRSMCKEIID